MATMTIADVRSKFPDYNDLSDQELADKLHAKFYSDIPKQDFYDKIGFQGGKLDTLKRDLGYGMQGYEPSQRGGALGMAESIRNFIGAVPQEAAAGLASGIQGIANLLPGTGRNVYPDEYRNKISPDAYAAFGTTDKPYNTPGGLVQTLASLYMPGKAVAEVPTGVKTIAENFKPGKVANELVDNLGKGAINTEENTKAITDELRNRHDMNEENAQSYYNHVLNNVGDEKVFDRPYALTSTATDKYKSVINKMEDLNIGDLFDSFKKDQTINNAHNLQSELGVMIGDLQKQPMTIDLAKQIKGLKGIRDEIKSGITDRLGEIDDVQGTRYKTSYETGTDIYRDDVVPYLSSKKLRDIVRGGKTVVKNIHGIFENPSNIIDRMTGEEKIGPINKIMQDVSPEINDRILFSKLGGNTLRDNPEGLLNNLNKLEQEGYSRYFSPEVKAKMKEMEIKQNNLNKLKMASKVGGFGVASGITAALMRHFGRI